MSGGVPRLPGMAARWRAWIGLAAAMTAAMAWAQPLAPSPPSSPPASPSPSPADLDLLDVVLPASPSWWPPAPGWWLVLAMVAAVALAVGWWRRSLRRRRRAVEALFDAGVDSADGVPARIAAISELLRRASRRRDPGADRLQGEAWLAFLDEGRRSRAFAGEAGRTLLDGGFRRDAGQAQLQALREVARVRFADWMVRRPRKGART